CCAPTTRCRSCRATCSPPTTCARRCARSWIAARGTPRSPGADRPRSADQLGARRDRPQPLAHRRARVVEGPRVVVERRAGVGGADERVELERELLGVDVRVQLAGLAGALDRPDEPVPPRVLLALERVAHPPGAGAELHLGG